MNIPVLNINQFQKEELLENFYINSLSNHISLNKTLISKPHKHNFYLCVIFTKGTGVHEIDFNSYSIEAGKIFFLRPGQTHFWKFNSNPEGFILFHSREFYELKFLDHKLSTFPFYNSFLNPPLLAFSQKPIERLLKKFQEIYTEYVQNNTLRELKIVSLINTVYIDILREYSLHREFDNRFSSNYLKLFQEFEILLNENFQTEKFPKFYARELNITTKHLNRIIKELINKTTSDLISERIILEAKRLIVHTEESLSHIANRLEFSDYSYFSKMFKSRTGLNPIDFRRKYNNLA